MAGAGAEATLRGQGWVGLAAFVTTGMFRARGLERQQPMCQRVRPSHLQHGTCLGARAPLWCCVTLGLNPPLSHTWCHIRLAILFPPRCLMPATGDHGHQQGGHAGPSPAETGAPGPEDRVPAAGPPPEALDFPGAGLVHGDAWLLCLVPSCVMTAPCTFVFTPLQHVHWDAVLSGWEQLADPNVRDCRSSQQQQQQPTPFVPRPGTQGHAASG